MVVATVAASLSFTIWAGRILGVDRHLSVLIATGTSICGASAVIATSTATGSDDEDIAYAIAMVTVFGTAAMALYPLAEAALGLTAHAYGLWAGASIHEVAQAVAAAFAGGDTSGEVGTIAKLSRVILLAPIVAGIGMAIARGHLLTKNEDGETATRGSVPVPWFVGGFLAMVVVASTGVLPDAVTGFAAQTSSFLLTMGPCRDGVGDRHRQAAAQGASPAGAGRAVGAVHLGNRVVPCPACLLTMAGRRCRP